MFRSYITQPYNNTERAEVDVLINGIETKMCVDTGTEACILSRSESHKLKLKLDDTEMHVTGANGITKNV